MGHADGGDGTQSTLTKGIVEEVVSKPSGNGNSPEPKAARDARENRHKYSYGDCNGCKTLSQLATMVREYTAEGTLFGIMTPIRE